MWRSSTVMVSSEDLSDDYDKEYKQTMCRVAAGLSSMLQLK